MSINYFIFEKRTRIYIFGYIYIYKDGCTLMSIIPSLKRGLGYIFLGIYIYIHILDGAFLMMYNYQLMSYIFVCMYL